MIQCPKCGHDEINVPVWGGADTKDGEIFTNEMLNIDYKDDTTRCKRCEHEGFFSDFEI